LALLTQYLLVVAGLAALVATPVRKGQVLHLLAVLLLAAGMAEEVLLLARAVMVGLVVVVTDTTAQLMQTLLAVLPHQDRAMRVVMDTMLVALICLLAVVEVRALLVETNQHLHQVQVV
jgi:hypothetical protein